MVLWILMLKIISYAFAAKLKQDFEVPPLCGKSFIAYNRVDFEFEGIFDERLNSVSSGIAADSDDEDERSGKTRPRLIPFVASVQRFDTNLEDDVDLFDKRLSGAFAGTILGPSVVLVACRCVARHLGLVGGDDQSVWDPKQFGVMAGTPWDYSPVDEFVGQIRFAVRIVVHPRCELSTDFFLWDMAVLVVESPFIFIKNKVEAAPVPETSKELRDYLELASSQRMSYFTAAWGWSFNSHKPHHLGLQLHPLFVREWKSCYHKSSGHMEANMTKMYVCVETASSYLRLRRTGDVGSPLLGFLGGNETTKEIYYIVLGIKSDEDSDTPDGFSLFTRLDIDLRWLYDIKRNPPKPVSVASAAKIASILEVLFMGWTRIWNSLSSN